MFISTKYCLETSKNNIQRVSVNSLWNSPDPGECRVPAECSGVFHLPDAWQLFQTWHRAELVQKIHETWENLSKTPVNTLRTSVWWTENSVNLSGVSVPNLEIKVTSRVKRAVWFLLRVQDAAHCWKWSVSKASIPVLRRGIMAELLCVCCPSITWEAQEEVTEQGPGYGAGQQARGDRARHVNAQQQNSF